jgi:hypothetical protein
MKELICKKILELQTDFNVWIKGDERFGFSSSPVSGTNTKYEFLFCSKEIDFKKDDPKEILKAVIGSSIFSITVYSNIITIKINGIEVDFLFEEFIETFSEASELLKNWVEYSIDKNPKRSKA